MTEPMKIALIDDDTDVLDALTMFLKSERFEVTAFERAPAFLEALAAGLACDCIVSDVSMPDLDGLELQRMLATDGKDIPLILITGHGDIQMAVKAIKAGAHDFLEKPFNERALATSIRAAVAAGARRESERRETAEIEAHIASLSERQRQVMRLAVQGMTNKEIAAALSISPRTVEDYRAWAMQRLGAKTLAELVRLVTLADLAARK